jgi:uncharacterized membrane protein
VTTGWWAGRRPTTAHPRNPTPWSFIGALLLTGLAAALHLRADNRSMLPRIASAFVLYLAAVAITLALNLPRNDAIKAAGPHARVMVRGCGRGVS